MSVLRINVVDRRFILAIAVVLLVCCASCSPSVDGQANIAETEPTAGQWSNYEGAWFTVEYPPSFDVVPSLKSDDTEGFDSVFFEAPDSAARFYVLSPQWGRAAVDVSIEPDVEIELDSNRQFIDEQERVTTTIHAKDGSYTRSVEEYREQDGAVYWVFEFSYANEVERERYAPSFERFKASLKQYSD
jgi:hypothetical protein